MEDAINNTPVWTLSTGEQLNMEDVTNNTPVWTLSTGEQLNMEDVINNTPVWTLSTGEHGGRHQQHPGVDVEHRGTWRTSSTTPRCGR
eukprot:TRINITY_DN23935_c0_g2_i1.p1 TRINITY_DN23935_c0_g2~~TRINITY_DN23935_c0_g2_i1.p1  ORF type:complete len:100 (+),score=28.23 TRINITY_DN23935_c0_g2_i1:38-301(+)